MRHLIKRRPTEHWYSLPETVGIRTRRNLHEAGCPEI